MFNDVPFVLFKSTITYRRSRVSMENVVLLVLWNKEGQLKYLALSETLYSEKIQGKHQATEKLQGIHVKIYWLEFIYLESL